MAIVNFPMVNKRPGSGAVSTQGTYPVGGIVRANRTFNSVANAYGVTLGSTGSGTRPSVGQVFPLGRN